MVKSKVSVIIPARNEIYLKETVDDLLNKATGDIEVIVILDGYWPQTVFQEDKRLIVVHRDKKGMRASINDGVAIARGEYIMKIDAHCLFAEGYDEVLKADCDKDWLVVPRRYSLECETTPWTIRQYRPFVDYEYLGWPYNHRLIHGSKMGIHAWVWDDRIASRINKLLDENMTFQGSCWLMPIEFFNRRIGQLNNEGYGTFIGEAQEIGLKVWLGGGKVMVNKKTWYAHLWKGQPYRDKYKAMFGVPYTRLSWHEAVEGNKYSVEYWIQNKWEERKHDLSWLIERFWPVPSWPEDRSLWTSPQP